MRGDQVAAAVEVVDVDRQRAALATPPARDREQHHRPQDRDRDPEPKESRDEPGDAGHREPRRHRAAVATGATPTLGEHEAEQAEQRPERDWRAAGCSCSAWA